MRIRYWRVMALAVVMVLLAPIAAIGADQTVEVTVLAAGTLAIDVEHDFNLGIAVPDTTTAENGFHMDIINLTGGAWEVTVAATDLTSFYWDNCDENGCHDRVDTETLYTIDASNIFMTGGAVDHWGDPAAVTGSVGAYMGTAGTSMLLVEGTAVANGSFNIDDPHTTIKVDIPATAETGHNYSPPLTTTTITPPPLGHGGPRRSTPGWVNYAGAPHLQ